jgi:uncharacterized protein involved in tolerance to divalent cations
MLETKMEISTKFMAPLALIGCLTMVAACSTVSTKEGTEHWDEVSAMGKTSQVRRGECCARVQQCHRGRGPHGLSHPTR